MPTLLLYGHLAPTLPAALLEALRPVAGTPVGIAGTDRSGAPELLLTGPAAEALAERIGPPVLAPGSDAVILGGRQAGTVVRVIETTEAHLFPSEWRGPAGPSGGRGRLDALGAAGQPSPAADGVARPRACLALGTRQVRTTEARYAL